MAVNEARLMEFLGRFAGDLGATMAAGKIVPGDKLGLYRALADDPLGAARNVLQQLADDGTWMIVEPFAGATVGDNLNPVGRVFCSFSDLASASRKRSPRRAATPSAPRLARSPCAGSPPTPDSAGSAGSPRPRQRPPAAKPAQLPAQ